MESVEIISLSLGILATTLSVVGNQFRKMMLVLAFQIASNLLVSVQYILEGTPTTSIVVYIAILQIVISMYLNSRGKSLAQTVGIVIHIVPPS